MNKNWKSWEIYQVVRLAYWKRHFLLQKKRKGILYHHATLSPSADTKTTSGLADLYQMFTYTIRHIGEGVDTTNDPL